MTRPMKIGVISDTHGYLDPRIPQIFKGVEHILHGGDIGPASLILELEQIAPVTAVLGNTDAGLDVPETKRLELNGQRFFLHHIVEVHALGKVLSRQPAGEKPTAVIFGHTHKPHEQIIDGMLFLNPGYAGRQRFDLPRSVAILECTPTMLRVEFVALSGPGAS
jgi:putative phosphoesterase